MNSNTKGLFLAIMAPLMWGVMGVIVRLLLEAGLSNLNIALLRCAIGGTGFFFILLFVNPKLLKIEKKGLIICAIYGTVCFSISFLTFGIAVERISIAIATVLMFMSPIWVMLFNVIFLKKKMSKRNFLSVILCVFGVVLISEIFVEKHIRLDIIGVIAGIVNGMGLAAQIIVPNMLAHKYKRDTVLVYGMLFAMVFLLPFSGLGFLTNVNWSADVLWQVLAVGVLCTLIANVVYVKATQYINTLKTSVISSLEVVVATVSAYIVFHESISIIQFFGATIIILATLGNEILDMYKRKNSGYKKHI